MSRPLPTFAEMGNILAAALARANETQRSAPRRLASTEAHGPNHQEGTNMGTVAKKIEAGELRRVAMQVATDLEETTMPARLAAKVLDGAALAPAETRRLARWLDAVADDRGEGPISETLRVAARGGDAVEMIATTSGYLTRLASLEIQLSRGAA